MAMKERAHSATDILRRDHDTVLELFMRYEDATDSKERESIVKVLCSELTSHMELEETVFYPAAQKELNDEQFISESKSEHDEVKVIISQLQRLLIDEDSKEWEENLTRLRSAVESHVQDEEELLFSRIDESSLALDEIASEMLEHRAERREAPEWLPVREEPIVDQRKSA